MKNILYFLSITALFSFVIFSFSNCNNKKEYPVEITVKYLDMPNKAVQNCQVRIGYEIGDSIVSDSIITVIDGKTENKKMLSGEKTTNYEGKVTHTFGSDGILKIKARLTIPAHDTIPPIILKEQNNPTIKLAENETVYKVVYIK